LANAVPKNTSSLTSGRTLTRNTIWNIIGQSAPLLVAFFAIPLLIKGLGTDRFGVLTLAWAVVGYFSLFDLGLGRALTKLVAEKLGAGQAEDVPVLIRTALFLMGLLGITGALVASGLSPWLVQDILKIPQALQGETLNGFYLLSLSIPVVISTAGFRGVLEAHQRFGQINAVRIPIGMFTFLGPLMVLPFSNSLLPVVAVLVILRFIALSVYTLLCLRLVPALQHSLTIKRHIVGPLVSFGGWMTVTNIVGPLMVYLDRFLIGALISVTAVAYYTTPYEVVTKLWLISGALVGVLFPAFSTSFVQDRKHTAQLFDRSVKYIFLALFPVTLIIVVLAHEGLNLWLGDKFAQNSTFVLQWLAVGVFINSIAQIPFAFIQGAGRPDLTAKLHLIEFPFYLLILWWLISSYGIEGAAIAWVGRAGFDSLVLFAIAGRLLPRTSHMLWYIMLILILCGLIMGIAVLAKVIAMKLCILFFILIIFGLFSWGVILEPWERDILKNRIRGKKAYA